LPIGARGPVERPPCRGQTHASVGQCDHSWLLDKWGARPSLSQRSILSCAAQCSSRRGLTALRPGRHLPFGHLLAAWRARATGSVPRNIALSGPMPACDPDNAGAPGTFSNPSAGCDPERPFGAAVAGRRKGWEDYGPPAHLVGLRCAAHVEPDLMGDASRTSLVFFVVGLSLLCGSSSLLRGWAGRSGPGALPSPGPRGPLAHRAGSVSRLALTL